MLGLDNPLHIAFILVLLLLVFGAKRLPEMGKSLGQGLRGFKESISGNETAEHLSEAHAQPPIGIGELPATHVATDEHTATVSEHTPMQRVA
ncbi:MAG: twin-arginine translocase TatA/TatE family subunit [Solirubrobacteraceae bacterium]